MADQPLVPARSFGGVADAYDRGRPSYPREAAAWLVGEEPRSVLELGAGTGKLTARLVELGHDVLATDPDPAMLAVLHRDLPDVRTSVAAAEELPVPDRSVDVVVCAQAFHWLDLDRALPEVARVLRPGGRLSLVWNERDQRIPWVRRLGRLIGTRDQLREPSDHLAASGLLGPVEHASFGHWQLVDRSSVQDLVLSRSHVAVLDEAGRAAKVAEVLAFYDDYGRGMDGMQLPYAARCFRAPVLAPAQERAVTEAGAAHAAGEEPDAERSQDPAEPGGEPGEETVSDGTDTDMLLIDFR